MSDFDWVYPPGVSGDEPQIAGYPDPEDVCAECGTTDGALTECEMCNARFCLRHLTLDYYCRGCLDRIDRFVIDDEGEARL